MSTLRQSLIDAVTRFARRNSGPLRKQSGMKWDADHAAAIMSLIALHESNQAPDYWAIRAA